MALLRTTIGQDSGPIVRGEGVVLRGAQMGDYAAWAELRAMSREHLAPWEPQWSRDELTRSAFRRRVRHYQREARDDLGYAFLVFAETPKAPQHAAELSWGQPAHEHMLVGGVTLSNVRRGVTQAATLGYWLGAPFIGRGLMRHAIAAIIPFAFDVLRLHRIEAAIMPANAPSVRLIERAGFAREGLARRYLKIAGRWEDHIIYGLLSEDTGRTEGAVS